MKRLADAAVLAAWVAFLASALALLHGPAAASLALPPLSGAGSWIDRHGAATAAFAALRLTTIAAGWYLLVTTVVLLGARIADCGRAASVAEVWSAPFVARIVRAGVGVSLGTSSLVLAPAALGPVPVAAAAVAADDEPVIMRDLTAEAAPPEPAVAPAVVPAEPAEWAVQPGDSFWRIAESSLASAWGRPPTDREIDPYWRGLIAANRDRLTVRDNPDLLVPGQMLRTPAVPARP